MQFDRLGRLRSIEGAKRGASTGQTSTLISAERDIVLAPPDRSTWRALTRQGWRSAVRLPPTEETPAVSRPPVGGRVLVVGGDPGVTAVIAVGLRPRFETETGITVAEALAQVGKEPLSLIIVDLAHGDLDAAFSIRALPARSHSVAAARRSSTSSAPTMRSPSISTRLLARLVFLLVAWSARSCTIRAETYVRFAARSGSKWRSNFSCTRITSSSGWPK